MSGGESRLVVLKDGAQLPDEEARELWKEFSAHMDVNRGDMSGYAAKKGWHSVLPEHRAGKAVLIVSTTAEAEKAAKAAAAKVAAAKPAQKGGAQKGGGAPKGRGPKGPKGGGRPGGQGGGKGGKGRA